MYFLQRQGGRDAFWTFFTAYLVLLTPGKNPKSLASIRVASAVFRVLLLAVISLLVPDRVLFSFGLVILFARHRVQPAASDRRRRTDDDRVDPDGGRADRRHRRLGGEAGDRHARRLCDRSDRHLPVVAAGRRDGGR